MKLVTKIAIVATLASFMFAGVNINWGNTYSDDPLMLLWLLLLHLVYTLM